MFTPLKTTSLGLAIVALAVAPSISTSASGGAGDADHPHATEKVCVILPASEEDLYDTDLATEMRRALRRAERTFGIDGVAVQPDTNADIPAVLDDFLQGGHCDMIAGDFFVGAAMEPMLSAHFDQRFVALDYLFQGDPSNARGVYFAADEPSFMAGYAAAALTNTGKVGVYGGLPIPAVTLFMDGFALGVQHYNERMGTAVEVLGWDVETGSGLFSFTFDDIEIGRILTEQLFREGADIVLPVAGPLQLGSLRAAQDHKAAGDDVKVIGVDIDLFKIVGGDRSRVILTSVTKAFGKALFRQIQDLYEHRWEPGVTVENLNTEGVDLAPWHRTRREIPRWLRRDLRRIERAIERGDVATEVDRSTGPPLGERFVNATNEHSYALIEAETFEGLEQEAVAFGGHVVTIDDAEEQTWLYDTFGLGEYLIGLNDIAVADDFVWTSGESVAYTNWCVGEPNDANDGEEVTIMSFMGAACWNDVPAGGGLAIAEAERPVDAQLDVWYTNPADGHRYVAIHTADYADARVQATSLGGDLVTIGDADEQTWLFAAFGVSPFLIGLNDIDLEGTFTWTSGEAVGYTNWCPGQPNDGGGNEDVVHMGFETNVCWNDVPDWGNDVAIVEVAP